MHVYNEDTFLDNFRKIREDLIKQEPTQVGTWQSQKIDTPMLELLNVVMEMPMPEDEGLVGPATGARLPWAEDHFQERIGGKPLNPSPSEAWWPFRKKTADGDTNKEHKSEGEAFSHTYPERMWPKLANGGDQTHANEMHHGIRFTYGDLQDVVDQLARDPHTRQAYLPIWFPEDTGAVHGKRVPCTLGYHFQVRGGKLNVSYFMRSTDFLRHFQDDIYMAVRLAHRVADALGHRRFQYTDGVEDLELKMGNIIFHTANMHIFEPDLALINFWKTQGKDWF